MPDSDPSDIRLKRAVTIWNDSGGVGKTTVTANTAEALARDGHDVLVIDLDPQYGGLTDHAGYQGALTRSDYNIVDALITPHRSLEELVIDHNDVSGLQWDLIPAHESLEEFGKRIENTLDPGQSSLTSLRQSVIEAGFPQQYEYILIDCRASRGDLVASAIATTLNVVIPTEFSRKGARSVDGLINYVKDLQRKLRNQPSMPTNVQTGVIAIVPNNAAKTGQLTTSEQDSLSYLLEEYQSKMPSFYIPSRTVLAQAWKNQRPLVEFIESSNRSLRENEKQLLTMFDLIAQMITAGSAQDVDDSAVANIPESCHPAPDGQRQQQVTAFGGDA